MTGLHLVGRNWMRSLSKHISDGIAHLNVTWAATIYSIYYCCQFDTWAMKWLVAATKLRSKYSRVRHNVIGQSSSTLVKHMSTFRPYNNMYFKVYTLLRTSVLRREPLDLLLYIGFGAVNYRHCDGSGQWVCSTFGIVVGVPFSGSKYTFYEAQR